MMSRGLEPLEEQSGLFREAFSVVDQSKENEDESDAHHHRDGADGDSQKHGDLKMSELRKVPRSFHAEQIDQAEHKDQEHQQQPEEEPDIEGGVLVNHASSLAIGLIVYQ